MNMVIVFAESRIWLELYLYPIIIHDQTFYVYLILIQVGYDILFRCMPVKDFWDVLKYLSRKAKCIDVIVFDVFNAAFCLSLT